MTALRPYQAERVAAAVEGLRAGRSGRIVMATGTGKTAVAVEVARQVGGRPLVLVPRRALVDQWRAVAGDVVDVATVQSLREPPTGRPFIVADEAHGFATEGRRRLLLGAGCPLLGLTATPKRLDGADVRELFPDEWGAPYRITEALRDGHLVDCRPFRVHVEEGGCRSVACDSPEHNRQILAHWHRLAAGRKTIAFLPTIEWADHLAEAAGGLAVSLHTRSRARVEDWRASSVPLACSVDQFFEGFDAPEISAIIFVRGTQSDRIKVQGIGRGLRPSPGKTDLILIDVAGVADSIDWRGLYDLDDVAEIIPALTRPRADMLDPEDGLELPTLWEVTTWLEEMTAWSAQIRRSYRWGRIPGAMVLGHGPRELLMVRAENETRCGVYVLEWDRGRPSARRLGRDFLEANAFSVAEARMGMGQTAIEGTEAVRRYEQWQRDRQPPGPKLAAALRAEGIEVPGTHGEAVRANRRAYAMRQARVA
jgi:hypothetical protein